MAVIKQLDSGVQLFTAIGGYGGSSTRTELAAGLIGLRAQGPVHIGSDSKAFVNKATELVGILSKGGNPQQYRSWRIRTDGDLWDHFCRIVIAKGPHAVRFTWVKGHATDENVARYYCSR